MQVTHVWFDAKTLVSQIISGKTEYLMNDLYLGRRLWLWVYTLEKG